MSDSDPRERVLALLQRYGWNTTSFQVLERGFEYWFDDADDGCVAYVDTGSAWVAAGAPIAPPAALRAIAVRFVDAARRAGRRVCFFAVEERLVVGSEGVLDAMPIGEEPAWDPAAWSANVRETRSLREQLRRARAKGVTVRRLEASDLSALGSSTRRDVEGLVARWLEARRMPPMGFVVDVQLFDFAGERRCYAAERDGVLVGLLAAVPVFLRRGWFFEDFLRTADAPNGTAELLVDHAMRDVAASGSRYVTLGLAPLSGQLDAWLDLARRWTAALYDFDGLRRFKAKLRPQSWTPILLAWPKSQSGNLALYDSLAAFTMRPAHGRRRASFVRFGLETLAHAPTAAVRVLAVLLVPWTLALALAPTRAFFPSLRIQLAWVVWDVVLAAGMFSLAVRWRASLARLLAVATSLDAALTLLELVLDGGRRIAGPLALSVVLVACAGPLLATSLLWGALLWRSDRNPTWRAPH